jgi:hypothetical protein
MLAPHAAITPMLTADRHERLRRLALRRRRPEAVEPRGTGRSLGPPGPTAAPRRDPVEPIVLHEHEHEHEHGPQPAPEREVAGAR